MWGYLRQLALLRARGRRGGGGARLKAWRVGVRRQPRPVTPIFIHCNLLPYFLLSISRNRYLILVTSLPIIKVRKSSNRMNTEAALEGKLVLVRNAVMK